MNIRNSLASHPSGAGVQAPHGQDVAPAGAPPPSPWRAAADAPTGPLEGLAARGLRPGAAGASSEAGPSRVVVQRTSLLNLAKAALHGDPKPSTNTSRQAKEVLDKRLISPFSPNWRIAGYAGRDHLNSMMLSTGIGAVWTHLHHADPDIHPDARLDALGSMEASGHALVFQKQLLAHLEETTDKDPSTRVQMSLRSIPGFDAVGQTMASRSTADIARSIAQQDGHAAVSVVMTLEQAGRAKPEGASGIQVHQLITYKRPNHDNVRVMDPNRGEFDVSTKDMKEFLRASRDTAFNDQTGRISTFSWNFTALAPGKSAADSPLKALDGLLRERADTQLAPSAERLAESMAFLSARQTGKFKQRSEIDAKFPERTEAMCAGLSTIWLHLHSAEPHTDTGTRLQALGSQLGMEHSVIYQNALSAEWADNNFDRAAKMIAVQEPMLTLYGARTDQVERYTRSTKVMAEGIAALAGYAMVGWVATVKQQDDATGKLSLRNGAHQMVCHKRADEGEVTFFDPNQGEFKYPVGETERFLNALRDVPLPGVPGELVGHDWEFFKITPGESDESSPLHGLLSTFKASSRASSNVAAGSGESPS